MLKWKGVKKCPVDLDSNWLSGMQGNEIGIGFHIANRSGKQIVSLALPCGWEERERDHAEFILPAWVGVGIPLRGNEGCQCSVAGTTALAMVGLQDALGCSWDALLQ